MKKSVLTAAALCCAMAWPMSALAHRSFLLPAQTQIEGKDPWVTVDAAVAENLFDFDGTPILLDGLAITGPDGQRVAPEHSFTGKRRSVFDVKLAQPGTYRLAVLGESAMASYQLNGESKRWRGNADALQREIPVDATAVQVTRTYTRLETYVSAGKPNRTALQPSGQGLEVVPLGHPNELMAGEQSSFRVLLDGQPLPDLKVAVVPGGVRYRGVLKEMLVTTDARGEFSVVWPFAEMYWINVSYPARPAPPAEGQPRPLPPAKRYGYSGTFEVVPQ